jgi:FkbM family methyltransferase
MSIPLQQADPTTSAVIRKADAVWSIWKTPARLLLDKLAYRIVGKIINRTLTTGYFAYPLVVPVRDLIGRRLIATGSFERTQFEALDRLLTEATTLVGINPNLKGALVDVGANIGLYTVRYAPLFVQTIAIEANPATYHALQANIALARSPNTKAVCLAASNVKGTAQLKVAESGMLGWSRLADDAGWATYTVDVPLNTLDNIVDEAFGQARVALIKIDVEGHELEVLQGAAAVINRDGPIILFEALSGEAGRSAIGQLRGAGYNDFFVFERDASFRGLLRGLPVSARRVDPDAPSKNTMICAIRGDAPQS